MVHKLCWPKAHGAMGESDYHCDDNVVAKLSCCSPHTTTRGLKGPALANFPAAHFLCAKVGGFGMMFARPSPLWEFCPSQGGFSQRGGDSKCHFFRSCKDPPRALSDARGMGKSTFMLVPDSSACVAHGALAGPPPSAWSAREVHVDLGFLGTMLHVLCEYRVLSV